MTPSRRPPPAFALVDVLCSLALCAFLALAVASAAALLRRSSADASRDLDAALLLSSLHASLAPNPSAAPPDLPAPWILESEPVTLPLPPEWLAAPTPANLPPPHPARRFLLRSPSARIPFTLPL